MARRGVGDLEPVANLELLRDRLMHAIQVAMRRANVWTFRDGRVVWFRSFSSPEDALREAGAEPEPG